MSDNNYAFIDAQNLYFGTTRCSDCAKKLNINIENIKLSDCVCGNAWKVDLFKFRTFLKNKYGVKNAFYYIGYFDNNNGDLYTSIQRAGFILTFKEHNSEMKSTKKGNVDIDIMFDIMRIIHEEGDSFDKIILVSGDGDYKKVVDFLIKEDRFKKVLFPGNNRSSLYKQLGNNYFSFLSSPDIKKKIIRR